MAYEERRIGRQKVRYNSANDDNALVFQLLVDGAKVTPTSATITIYEPGNSTAVLGSTSMTKSGTLLTYTPDTTTVADYPVGEGYRADIVVTYNSLTYDRHIMFDVVTYLLELNIGRDQLVAIDAQLRAAEFGGDSDFSNLIQACRDDLQAMIEAHVIDNDRLVENMILDSARVAPAARYYVLAQYMRSNGHDDKASEYKGMFEELFRSALSSIQYDTGQDGEEDSEMGGPQHIRLQL